MLWREIADAVAFRHGVTLDELRGPSVKRSITKARQELCSELHATGRFSTTKIGQLLGGRDHTTVLFGIRRHRERAEAAKKSSTGCGKVPETCFRPRQNSAAS